MRGSGLRLCAHHLLSYGNLELMISNCLIETRILSQSACVFSLGYFLNKCTCRGGFHRKIQKALQRLPVPR